MKREQAYSILGLDPNASEEEVKKKYRDLSKKMHPDVNKDPDATDKYKQINEAYTRIKDGDFEQEMNFQGGGFSGFSGFPNIEDLINFHTGFGDQNNVVNLPVIQIPLAISFKESIFGSKKEISYSRKVKCNTCNGMGKKTLNNGCDACGGKGKNVIQRGNMLITSPCAKCHGRMKVESCNTCSGLGAVDSQTTISINIPPGIENNNTLRLSNIGNFHSTGGFGDRYADAYVRVQVINDTNLKLENKDVVCTLNLSLLEALEGIKKKVETLEGEKEITVKPLSKHKEEIVIPNLGVARQGNQRVILQVEYPSNITDLINKLKEN